MDSFSCRPLPVMPPGPDEVEALRGAARYLRRAGTRAATDTLDPSAPTHDAMLRQAIRDNLLAAADLCASLIDLADADRPPERDPSRPSR